jgi:hypothetical protein
LSALGEVAVTSNQEGLINVNTLEASENARLASAEQLYTEMLGTVESRIAALPA